MTATATWSDYHQSDVTNYWAWTTYDTTVATVGNSNGYLTTVGAGGTTVDFTYNLTPQPYPGTCDLYTDCDQNAEEEGDAPGNVAPTITGPNTVWYFGGLSPSGFATSISLSSQSGVTWSVTAGSDKITLSPNGGTATVTSSGTAFSNATGDVTITATANGVTSQPFAITTRVPKSLASNGSPTDTGRGTNCDVSGSAGYQSQIPYKILDQLGATITNAPINEHLPNETPSQTNNWPYTQGGFLSTDGTFSDFVCVSGFSGANPAPTQPQNPLTNNLVDTISQTWFVGTTDPNSGTPVVRVQSDNILRYTDHGRHTSVVSPPSTWPH